MEFAVAIIGAGPAGISAALSCRRAGLRTIVISLDAPRFRAALPETLSPIARTPLSALGVWDDFVACQFPLNRNLASVWGSDHRTERHSLYNALGAGWYIDRPRFDNLLREKALQAGAHLISPARVSGVERRQSGWQLKTGQDRKNVIMADFVIDASGRSSAFARLLGIRRRSRDRLVSIAAHLTPVYPTDRETLVESAENGWWFSAPTSSHSIAVGYFTEGGLVQPLLREPRAWMRLLDQTRHTKKRVHTVRNPDLCARIASTSYLLRHSGNGWLAAGDASACYDPLSSQGLLRAVESGYTAGLVCQNALSGMDEHLDHYDAQQREACARFITERSHIYALEPRWTHSIFWSSRSRPDLSNLALANTVNTVAKQLKELSK